MKSWIVGLVLVGIALPLINCQGLENDDDYEVKRFNIQGRQLGGPSTCVVTRRKRSPLQGADGEMQEAKEANDEDDQESALGVSTAGASDTSSSSGLLIRDQDLAGNAGILVIQNGPQPDSPLLFELRPVQTGAQESFLRVGDIDDPDADDDLDMDNGMSDNNNNRYKPIEVTDTNSMAAPKRRGQRRPQSRPTEIVNSPPIRPIRKNRRPNKNNKQRQQNRKKNQNKNQNRIKNRKRKPNANRNGIRNGNRRVVAGNTQRIQSNRNKTNKRRKNLNNRVDSQMKKDKRIGLNVNKGNMVNTYTKTVTTTHTGTANDIPDVNCIIISKPPPPPTTEKPFWNILGRSAAPRDRDSRYGLRKRVNRRLA